MLIVVALDWVRIDLAELLEKPVRHRHLFDALLASPLILLGFALLHWRLRIDERRMSRQGPLGGALWPWGAFRDGRVIATDSLYIYDRCDRPWWGSPLSLTIISEDDRARAWSLIEERWARRPDPEPPGSLVVCDRFTRRVELEDWEQHDERVLSGLGDYFGKRRRYAHRSDERQSLHSRLWTVSAHRVPSSLGIG